MEIKQAASKPRKPIKHKNIPTDVLLTRASLACLASSSSWKRRLSSSSLACSASSRSCFSLASLWFSIWKQNEQSHFSGFASESHLGLRQHSKWLEWKDCSLASGLILTRDAVLELLALCSTELLQWVTLVSSELLVEHLDQSDLSSYL